MSDWKTKLYRAWKREKQHFESTQQRHDRLLSEAETLAALIKQIEDKSGKKVAQIGICESRDMRDRLDSVYFFA